MFVEFYLLLKRMGVPVSMNEWMTLLEALESGMAEASLETFYYLARSILIKNETYFDRYDQAFQHFFKGAEVSEEILDEILEGLKEVEPLVLTEEEKALIQRLSLDEVLENFRKQYEEGHFREHVGGDRAIGTGGRSTQGAFGYNPAGIRIGQGGSRHGSAIQIAEKRLYRNYSSDLVLDTRMVRVALSRLRTLLPTGPLSELDVDGTVDKTCRNAGDLELVWERERKNKVKLIIMMDSGGSMEPYHAAVSRVFSAARSQFKDLKYYYFHNCVYQDLWTDIRMGESIPTEDILKTLDDDYKLIFVGDASMAPSELLDENGCIEYFYRNDIPGVWWLYKLVSKFKASVWLNPIRERSWNYSFSTRLIMKLLPMFELTLDGLDEAVRTLLMPTRAPVMPSEIQHIIEERYKAYPGFTRRY